MMLRLKLSHNSFYLPLFAMLLASCATQMPKSDSPTDEKKSAPIKVEIAKPELKTEGKYYKDDGPPLVDEIDWRTVSDPDPTFKPIDGRYNRPYEVFGVRYVPFTDYTHYTKRGVSSWYGRRYHGRKTSSGEIYNMYDMTAAHTVLPIPSYVRVTRVDDGRSIIVRVNDRGPFLQERVIDLSYVAARKLGIVSDGTAEVLVESLLPEEDVAPKSVESNANASIGNLPGTSQKVEELSSNYLQIGAFSTIDNANSLATDVALPATMKVSTIVVISANENLHRVLIGPYQNKTEAEEDLDQLHDAGMEALLKIF